MSDTNMSKPTRIRVNPSRKTCEEIIRRILSTENKENGSNIHFKTAMDFMSYFESLYPPGPGLVKQVQRAIKSMDLAKDENGYFILGKTKEEFSLEKEISSFMNKCEASVCDSETPFEVVILKTSEMGRSYLAELISESDYLSSLYISLIVSVNGLVFFTMDSAALKEALRGLIVPVQD